MVKGIKAKSTAPREYLHSSDKLECIVVEGQVSWKQERSLHVDLLCFEHLLTVHSLRCTRFIFGCLPTLSDRETWINIETAGSFKAERGERFLNNHNAGRL